MNLLSLKEENDWHLVTQRLEWMLSNKLAIFLIFYGASLSESSPNPEHCLGANPDLCGSLSRTHPYWTLLTGLSRAGQIYSAVTWLLSQPHEFEAHPSKQSDWNSKTFNPETSFSSKETKSSLWNRYLSSRKWRQGNATAAWDNSAAPDLDFVIVVWLIDFFVCFLFFPHSGNNSMKMDQRSLHGKN